MRPAIFSKQKVRALAVLSAAFLAAAVGMAGTTGTAHAAQAMPATTHASAQMTAGAQQQAASHTAGVATLTSATTHSTGARPATQTNPFLCTKVLADNGYLRLGDRLIKTRIGICIVASIPLENPEARWSGCTSAMALTGVDLATAGVACGAAVFGV